MSNDIVQPRWRFELIAQRLWQGAVIAYPTEGVWGLGCLPENEEGVARVLALKRRPWQKGLILVAADLAQFAPYLAGLTADRLAVLEQTWPGPVTFLVPDNGCAPPWIKGTHDQVALRVSDHPVVRGLCQAAGAPLVSTSANPGGRMPARSSLRVRQFFADAVDIIVPGALGGATGPSEIRDLMSGSVHRERSA